MKSFREVISAFGTASALAAELNEKPVTVRAWRLRNSIPSQYWFPIEALAKRKQIKGVTVDLLAKLASSASAERAA